MYTYSRLNKLWGCKLKSVGKVRVGEEALDSGETKKIIKSFFSFFFILIQLNQQNYMSNRKSEILERV